MSFASPAVIDAGKPEVRRVAGGITRTVNAGFAHHQAGRLERAEALYRKVLAKDSEHAEALHLLGVIAYQNGKFGTAIALIERALPALHDLPEAHLNLGNALREVGRFAEAADSYRRSIALEPDYGMAHSNLARALHDQGLFAAGLESSRRAIELIPDFPGAHLNCAAALMGLERFAEAEAPLRRLLDLTPERAETHNDLGRVLATLNRFDEAGLSYRRAVAFKPDYPEAHFNLGSALQAQGRLDEAVKSYRLAIALKPDYPEAHFNLGRALHAQDRLDEAIKRYRRALAMKPDYPEAHMNLGTALGQQYRLADALASFRRALVLNPDLAEAHYNLGIALKLEEKLREAIDSFGRAVVLDPDNGRALAAWFRAKQQICDWSGYPQNETRVRSALASQPTPGTPFALLALSSTPQEQFDCARRAAGMIVVPYAAALARPQPRSSERIRLGYLSEDFRQHPVAVLIAGLIEHHDRRHFEVIGYSYGQDDRSAMRARLAGAFDRFVDVRNMPYRRVAELIHADVVHILIDLTGLTGSCRTEALACRPAPIQVNYLGYPGTMGADFIDYIIVDLFVVPPDQQSFFSERLVHLPDCYQCNDDKRAIAELTPSRGECGLPDAGFVFCCFNSSHKITPAFFDTWMRLLRGLPGSVLWLLDDNPWAKANLAREARTRGVPPGRLVFARRLPPPEHLARHRVADLFLDTLPYNAHTTASDALWAGLPVLTCSGDTFAGRVAGSLLRAVELGELVTTSLDEYEALALRLAHEPEVLARLRTPIAQNRLTHPLFNTARFTRNIEAAYRQMWETWRAGRPPAAFSVPPPADMA
ncbi:MAG TPA: tetratricopeptide repeat protein [Stellaceae bacterium]|nr:tetratricopeptide repeat protein [Stellaceae bacterium]